MSGAFSYSQDNFNGTAADPKLNNFTSSVDNMMAGGHGRGSIGLADRHFKPIEAEARKIREQHKSNLSKSSSFL